MTEVPGEKAEEGKSKEIGGIRESLLTRVERWDLALGTERARHQAQVGRFKGQSCPDCGHSGPSLMLPGKDPISTIWNLYSSGVEGSVISIEGGYLSLKETAIKLMRGALNPKSKSLDGHSSQEATR